MSTQEIAEIAEIMPYEELQKLGHEAISYAFTIIGEAPKRFGKDWKTEPQAFRKLIEEAWVQGYLEGQTKYGKSEGQETRI
jgi:hypothetical protein